MDNSGILQQILGPLGVYAVTIVILIYICKILWGYLTKNIEELIKKMDVALANNTEAMHANRESTDKLIQKFDEFVSKPDNRMNKNKKYG